MFIRILPSGIMSQLRVVRCGKLLFTLYERKCDVVGSRLFLIIHLWTTFLIFKCVFTEKFHQVAPIQGEKNFSNKE